MQSQKQTTKEKEHRRDDIVTTPNRTLSDTRHPPLQMNTVSRQLEADDASAIAELRTLQEMIDMQATTMRRLRRLARRSAQGSAVSQRSTKSTQRTPEANAENEATSGNSLPSAVELRQPLAAWQL